jgi:hypothetical protein
MNTDRGGLKTETRHKGPDSAPRGHRNGTRVLLQSLFAISASNSRKKLIFNIIFCVFRGSEDREVTCNSQFDRHSVASNGHNRPWRRVILLLT